MMTENRYEQEKHDQVLDKLSVSEYEYHFKEKK